MEKEKVFEILESEFIDGKREIEELELLPHLASDADIFIDVGAELGPFSEKANHFLLNKTIFSIEADPLRFERLSEKASEWRKNSSNEINCLNFAIGHKDKKTKFFTAHTNTSGSLAPIKGRVEESDYIEITMKKLDTLFNFRNKNILVKIDVEGGEFGVIEGAKNIIENNKINFLIEFHSWGDTINKKFPHHLFLLLKRRGYKFRRIHTNYFFSKDLKRFESHNFFYHFLKWYAKRYLRNIPGILFLKKLIYLGK
tara:strand:+ start:1694 stop:2461 length:768 start_codon:yes stop_codon:yes gene_type:complete